MSGQDRLILLLLKVVLCADVAATLAFIGDYSRLTRWKWVRNPIGRTIVVKDILLVLAFTPSLLSLFVNFSRLTSHIAAWTDIGLFAGIAVTMCWRIAVFERIGRRGGLPRDGHGEKGKSNDAAS
jgi:hypothetical protein